MRGPTFCTRYTPCTDWLLALLFTHVYVENSLRWLLLYSYVRYRLHFHFLYLYVHFYFHFYFLPLLLLLPLPCHLSFKSAATPI